MKQPSVWSQARRLIQNDPTLRVLLWLALAGLAVVCLLLLLTL